MIDSKINLFSRRQILRQGLGTGLCLPFAQYLPASFVSSQPSATAGNPAAVSALSAEDDQLLMEVAQSSVLFFWEQGNPNTGMVKIRCNVHTLDKNDQKVASSIAA